jgi:flagellin-like protein
VADRGRQARSVAIDGRPKRPRLTSWVGGRVRGMGSILTAGPVQLVFDEETQLMRGPYGIVGLIVTIVVIFVLLRLLGVVQGGRSD